MAYWYSYAESSFLLNIFKNNNVNLGYSVKLVYKITAHSSNTDIMYNNKSFFNNIGNL